MTYLYKPLTHDVERELPARKTGGLLGWEGSHVMQGWKAGHLPST